MHAFVVSDYCLGGDCRTFQLCQVDNRITVPRGRLQVHHVLRRAQPGGRSVRSAERHREYQRLQSVHKRTAGLRRHLTKWR